MLRRFASVVAGGALAITSYSVMVTAPASAGERKPNHVEVTKVVVGDSKGTGFQVVVDCKKHDDGIMVFGENGSGPETLTFGPTGGTQTADAPEDSTCTIVETHDGGASKVEVSPSTCEFPKEDKETVPAATIDNHEGLTCEVTVTNTFEPKAEEVGPAGPQGPPGPPGETAVQPAQAVVSRGRFTG
jgi:hypothetical protein